MNMGQYLHYIIIILLSVAIIYVGSVIYSSQQPTKSLVLEESQSSISRHSSVVETPGEIIYVDVVGAVMRPGVYEFNLGARVFEAIEAAGGLRPDADINALSYSRASQLQDEQRIWIPSFNDKSQSLATVNPSTPSMDNDCVNINSATNSELEELSGIGPARSQAIVNGRPYKELEEIVEAGVPRSVFDDLHEQLCL